MSTRRSSSAWASRASSCPPSTVKQYEKLLVGGIWALVTLEYFFEEGQKGSPFSVRQLKPIQMPNMDMDELREARKHFTARAMARRAAALVRHGADHARHSASSGTCWRA